MQNEIIIALTVSLISITLVVLFLAYQLSSLKKILTNKYETEDGVLVLPEPFMDSLDKKTSRVEAANAQLADYLVKLSDKLARDSDSYNGAVTAIKETLDIFAQQTREKEHEVVRLKAGYDAYLVNKFSDRLAKVFTLLEKEIDASETQKERELFSDVLEAIESALEGVGIESFEPVIGEDVNQAFGINANIKTIDTDDQAKHGQIAQVLKPGLRILSGDANNQPIKKAQVTAYAFKEN